MQEDGEKGLIASSEVVAERIYPPGGGPWGRPDRKRLTSGKLGDKLITMTIQDTLKELVGKRGLRKVASGMDIDHGQLYRSINSDLRVSTLQDILNFLGYDLKIVKRREVKPGRSKES